MPRHALDRSTRAERYKRMARSFKGPADRNCSCLPHPIGHDKQRVDRHHNDCVTYTHIHARMSTVRFSSARTSIDVTSSVGTVTVPAHFVCSQEHCSCQLGEHMACYTWTVSGHKWYRGSSWGRSDVRDLCLQVRNRLFDAARNQVTRFEVDLLELKGSVANRRTKPNDRNLKGPP